MLEEGEFDEWIKLDPSVIFNYRVKKGQIFITDEDLYDPKRKEAETMRLYEPLEYIKDNYGLPEGNQDLIKAINYWVKAPDDVFEKIEEALQFFPAMAIMGKELQQDIQTRNGKPTAHVKFGMARCINSIYFGYIVAYKSKFDHVKVKDIYTKGGVELCRIGHLQSIFIDSGICPTEEIHDLGIRKAVCTTFITEFNFLKALYNPDGKIVEVEDIVYYINLFLSIIEECRRLVVHDTDSVPFAEDIKYGYFTLPIIYAINNFPKEGNIILTIMRKRTKAVGILQYALDLIKQVGSFEYCKKKLQRIEKDIKEEYERLGPNPLLEEYIKKYIIVPNDFKDVDWGVNYAY